MPFSAESSAVIQFPDNNNNSYAAMSLHFLCLNNDEIPADNLEI